MMILGKRHSKMASLYTKWKSRDQEQIHVAQQPGINVQLFLNLSLALSYIVTVPCLCPALLLYMFSPFPRKIVHFLTIHFLKVIIQT